MPFTAKLLRLSKAHGRIDLEIQYSDGINEPINKHYGFERTNTEAIRALARREVTRLEELQEEVIAIVVGDDIDLSPPPPPPPTPPPTPAKLARRAWFQDWFKLQALLNLVESSIIPADDPRIAPLQTSLEADLLPSYLQDID